MDYFGSNNLQLDKEHTNKKSSGKGYQIYVGISSVIGLISILALIALNVTNLITTIGNSQGDRSIKSTLIDTNDVAHSIKTKISSSIDPKLSLITSSTTIDLPNMMSAHYKQLKTDIYKTCTPRFENTGESCPVKSQISHSSMFAEYNPEAWINCTGANYKSVAVPALNFTITKSITTQPTSPDGCVRIPTLEIGDSLFSYSDNIIQNGCHDASLSAQNWVIGTIQEGPSGIPEFDIAENWMLWDGVNRKSCSTVTSTINAWLVCTIVKITEVQDYNTKGIQDLWVGYMDIFGVRKSWIYDATHLQLDQDYSALYPAVGSGVIVDNNVYFLLYGGLWTDVNITSYCKLDNCQPATENTCYRAQRPKRFDRHRVINVILSFSDSSASKPLLNFKMIPPSQYPIGAEGRLYHFGSTRETFIYLRSTTWYSFLEFGKINLLGDLTITWYTYTTFTRPGQPPCNAGNKCPGECLTGVYTDFYPLSIDDGLGISIMLSGGSLRRGPMIRLADFSSVFLSKYLTNQNQQAAYTTTTCFMFEFRPWCASVVELSPGTIGQIEPVFLLYPIWSQCTIEALVYYPEYDYLYSE